MLKRGERMQVIRIPVLFDNYVFVLHDQDLKQAVVVDPATAGPVLHCLNELGAELVGIWNTHHHHDHVGGNRDLLKKFPDIEVIAGLYDHQKTRIPGQSQVVQEGDRISFANREVHILDCPGHTLGHIAYYLPSEDESDSHLFCGDTLFAGGCGRLFEGTPAQMMESLDKFKRLPPQTQVWCAHEYTQSNLKFALTQDTTNSTLKKRFEFVKQARKMNHSTVPTTVALELETNPFLRCDDPQLQETIGCDRPLDAFTLIRQRKDHF